MTDDDTGVPESSPLACDASFRTTRREGLISRAMSVRYKTNGGRGVASPSLGLLTPFAIERASERGATSRRDVEARARARTAADECGVRCGAARACRHHSASVG
jgi:hypothetical protein